MDLGLDLAIFFFIKIYLKEIGIKNAEWIILGQAKDQ